MKVITIKDVQIYKMEVPKLNRDVYTSIADFLDLSSLFNLSVASKLTKDACSYIPLTVVLIRDAESVSQFKHNLPPELIRLVIGKGAERTTPQVVNYFTDKQKLVMVAKFTALSTIINRFQDRFESEHFINSLKNLFSRALDIKNLKAMSLMVDINISKTSDVKALDQDFMEECIGVAVLNNHHDLLPFLAEIVGFTRINVETLVNNTKLARKNSQTRVFATLLALICRVEPDLTVINELISNSLHSTAQQGQEDLCLELAKMFQLRVRFKKIRAVKDRAAQSKRAISNVFSNINEELEEQRLNEEEGDITEAMKVFKRSLQLVLDTACRNNHTVLARKLLESKLASEVDDKIMLNFFKTAVGSNDIETAQWLVSSRKITLPVLCEYFINCARRNRENSIDILLSTKVIPNPTLDYAAKQATRYGHISLARKLQDCLI